MTQIFRYLSPEWTQEAHRCLREQLTPEQMKFVTSSMVTLYYDCPDGKDRALYYGMVNGVVEKLYVVEGEVPQAEFVISGDYETFAKISRAELGSRAALMNGKLRLKGNMVKALSFSSVVDRLNKVLSTVPTSF